MSGIKGMTPRSPKPTAVRRKVWQSMRIMRRFTITDLCRTSGAKRENVRKFVKRLETHGYIAQVGEYTKGRAGVFRGLRLVKDTGPDHPMHCDVCGRSLNQPCIKEKES